MWWLSSAWAAAPVTVVQDGDQFRFTVVVPAPLGTVRSFLRDPRNPAALSADGNFHITPRADGCWDSRFDMSYGPIAFGYLALTCDTALGSASHMVEGRSFKAMEFSWEAREVDGGTEVVYRYLGVLDLPLPKFLIHRSTRTSTVGLMERLAARFGAE